MSTEITLSHNAPSNQSLFLYVVDHLDKNGRYDGSPLPDDLTRSYSYGAEDAVMFHPRADNKYMEQAKDIYVLLKNWMKEPTQQNKDLLYERIYLTPQSTVFFTLAAQLRNEKLSYDLLDLAQEWFYTAKDREAVKFVYLICGLIGLQQVRNSFSESLYDDLFTLARCEEFTLFLCLACQLSELRPQKELWFLARHTEGWGKAITLLMLQCRTPAQRRWLLKKGLDICIFWPPLSSIIIKESRLPAMLKEETIPEDIYLAAADVIVQYMVFLAPCEELPDNPLEHSLMPPTQIALEQLLGDFLRHAKTYAVTPKNLLTIFFIKDRLEALEEEKKGAALTGNVAQLLIAQCDSLIFYKDWEPEIRATLFDSHGGLNQEIVDFAADLEVDIWPDIIRFYNAHPKDETALQYLMYAPVGDDLNRIDTRRHLFLDCAESHLRNYMKDEALLVRFAHYLKDYPGEGIPLLDACFSSIYEHAIGMAALAVSSWPRDSVPADLKKAVIRAIQLNQNPIIDQILKSIIDENVPSPMMFDFRER